MSDEIKADYDQLEQVATGFTNEAQAIEEMFQSVRGGMDNLQGAWVGRGSDAFFAEMQDEVIPALNRLRDALNDAGQVTKEISQTMEQADEEASSPFRAT